MTPLAIEGVALIGPGFADWAAARAVLAGEIPYAAAPAAVPAPLLLPPNERRRSGLAIKVALAAGAGALAACGREAAGIATVFASSSADGETCHAICEQLAGSDRLISPTRFHNSVHNAAAGYWSIATQCRAPSTSLCCHDWSFAAGLLDAASQVAVDGNPVALIVYDHPYPAPLGVARPIGATFGAALVLAPQASPAAIALLDIEFEPQKAGATRMDDPGLEALRSGVPAARCLPLLAALARRAREPVILEYVAGAHLRMAVTPCA